MNCRRAEGRSGYLVIPSGSPLGHISQLDTHKHTTPTPTQRWTEQRWSAGAPTCFMHKHICWGLLPHCCVSSQMKTGADLTSCLSPPTYGFHICPLFGVWISLPRSDVGQLRKAEPLWGLLLNCAACCRVLSSPSSFECKAHGAFLLLQHPAVWHTYIHKGLHTHFLHTLSLHCFFWQTCDLDSPLCDVL